MLTLQGSPLSWEEVLDRYSPLVFRLAWQSLGNRQDAEDAAQEVFVALVRSSPAFRDETHLRAWLIRATSHRCKNLAASAWKRHTVPLDPDWTPPAGAPPEAGPVLSAVGRLPEKYRTAVYLHYVEGYTAVEIAALLGCPRSTVLSRLMRARKLLRDMLKEEFDHDQC